jgi:hypothetical protein
VPTGSTSRWALDTLPSFTLKRRVQPSPRAPIESLLAELDQREKDLAGQLGELEEEIEKLRILKKPFGQRRLTRYDRLRESYWAVKLRLAQLRAQRPGWLPPGVSAPGDF